MEISPEARIKMEEYEGYQDYPIVRSSPEIVQDAVADGLMTKARILERFTEDVRLQLPGDDGEYPDSLQNIAECFERLKDESDNLDQERLNAFLHDILQNLGTAAAPGVVDTLVSIFNWHAAYPFPIDTSKEPNPQPLIDQAAFTRAIALLVLDPPGRINAAPHLTDPAIHGVATSMNNADISFSHITLRGRDARDLRRWLFRSLADASDGDSPIVFLPVPRVVATPQKRGSIAINESPTWYMASEDERLTDLVDVLAETYPVRRPSPYPTRESWEAVVAGLPRYERGLGELRVRGDVFNALIQLVSGLDATFEQKLSGLSVSKVAVLSWGEFDGLLGQEGRTDMIAGGLHRVFRHFKMSRP